MLQHRGNIFVLSAPSGAGKSTLARRLLQEIPNLIFSISTTTRPPREGEVHGRDYFFVDDATFDRMVAEQGFIEWVEVYGRRYGTGKAWISEKLAQGVDILLDIETRGASHVRTAIPDAEMIFLLPPSAQELSRRLRGRDTDTEEQIRTRLQYAKHEMEQYAAYDYLVVNDDLETAYRQLASIILAARARRARMQGVAEAILKGFE